MVHDRLIPRAQGLEFDALVARVAAGGDRGVNVTFPYAKRAAGQVAIADPPVRAIGAVETVRFDPQGPQGFNTDCTGFVAAYRRARGDLAPGPVLTIGAGGVGKAVAFGPVALGLEEIRIADRDLPEAQALAEALAEAPAAPRPGLVTAAGSDARALSPGAAGIVNCTPVGMAGCGGTTWPRSAMAVGAWVFDAVWTPRTRRGWPLPRPRGWPSSRATSWSRGRG